MPITPDRTRVLALHLTKPSNSEARVLSSLLRDLDDDITVDLVVNDAGDSDTASHFRDFDGLEHIFVDHMNIGLPVDPWKPDSAWQRALARSTHPLRRPKVAAVRPETGTPTSSIRASSGSTAGSVNLSPRSWAFHTSSTSTTSRGHGCGPQRCCASGRATTSSRSVVSLPAARWITGWHRNASP